MDKVEFSRQMSSELNEMTKAMSEEERKRLRQWMMDTQPKVKAPKLAYHATPSKNAESIRENGIIPHPAFGEIYLCDRLEDCLKFVPTPCTIFEIDTAELLPKRWRLSLDHQKQFYNCEVYCYFGHIPPKAIVKEYGKNV